MSQTLYRTTLVIWTAFDPSGMENTDLARESDSGDAFCASRETTPVTNPVEFPDTDFFDTDD